MDDNLLDDPRITAVGLFAEAYAGLAARLACQTAEHGLSPVEFEVLIRLARSPDSQLRMTDLSCQTSLTTSGVTRVVDRLERDNLVRRAACPTDRRSSYAVLTPQGRNRLDAVLPGHLELVERWLTGLLDPAQLEQLLRTLHVIRDAVRPGATAGSRTPDAPHPAHATAAGSAA